MDLIDQVGCIFRAGDAFDASKVLPRGDLGAEIFADFLVLGLEHSVEISDIGLILAVLGVLGLPVSEASGFVAGLELVPLALEFKVHVVCHFGFLLPVDPGRHDAPVLTTDYPDHV